MSQLRLKIFVIGLAVITPTLVLSETSGLVAAMFDRIENLGTSQMKTHKSLDALETGLEDYQKRIDKIISLLNQKQDSLRAEVSVASAYAIRISRESVMLSQHADTLREKIN
jgi:hypothetical protein